MGDSLDFFFNLTQNAALWANFEAINAHLKKNQKINMIKKGENCFSLNIYTLLRWFFPSKLLLYLDLKRIYMMKENYFSLIIHRPLRFFFSKWILRIWNESIYLCVHFNENGFNFILFPPVNGGPNLWKSASKLESRSKTTFLFLSIKWYHLEFQVMLKAAESVYIFP